MVAAMRSMADMRMLAWTEVLGTQALVATIGRNLPRRLLREVGRAALRPEAHGRGNVTSLAITAGNMIVGLLAWCRIA